MAGHGNYSQYSDGYGQGQNPFPSGPSEWEHEGGRLWLDMGPPIQDRARSQGTGRGTIMSHTVGGARSSGDQMHQRLGQTDSQRVAQEQGHQRAELAMDLFDDATASRAWRRSYEYGQDQAQFSSDYPDANERRTSPSNYLHSSGSGAGSGSGSGSQAGPQAESSRAGYIIPGHPTEQMEIEDPQMIAFPTPVAQVGHGSSTYDYDYPDPITGGNDDMYSQHVAPRPHRHSTHSSSHRRDSRRAHSDGCCCVIL